MEYHVAAEPASRWPRHHTGRLTRRILPRHDTELIDRIDMQHLEHDTPQIWDQTPEKFSQTYPLVEDMPEISEFQISGKMDAQPSGRQTT